MHAFRTFVAQQVKPQDVASWAETMDKAGGWGVAIILALVLVVTVGYLWRHILSLHADHKVELKAARDEADKKVDASHTKLVTLLEQQLDLLNDLK